MKRVLALFICLLGGLAAADDFGVHVVMSPPDTVRVGESHVPIATVYADAENEDTTLVAVVFRIGEEYEEEQEVLLSPGAALPVEFEPWIVEETGEFTARCSLDVEDDEVANDTASKPVTALPARFEFTLPAILLPDTVEWNEEGVFPAAIVTASEENEDDTTVTVRFRIGNTYCETEEIELGPDDCDTVEFEEWEPGESGLLMARCSVLTRVGLPHDDTLSRPVYVIPPWYDFAVTEMLEPPDTVDYGDTLTPEFSVCADTGNNSEVESLLVRLWIDSSYCDTAVVELEPGDTVSVEFKDWVARPLRNHVLICEVITPDSNPANDRFVAYTYADLEPGWSDVDDVPDGEREKAVKAGGWLCYDPTGDFIYGAKGNATNEFYAYDPGDDAWDEGLDTFPRIHGSRYVKKGAAGACDDSGRCIYATKGNSRTFWRYSIPADSWQQIDSVPRGPANRKAKAGTDIVWVTKNGHGYAYLLKGMTQEFYRYDPIENRWAEKLAAPAGASGQKKYKAGSFLVYDGDHTIYCHKSYFNELFTYDILSDSWTGQRSGMPFVSGITGKRRKSGDGACGAWLDGGFYAFKGKNTQEFWRYDAASDSWTEMDTIPYEGSSDGKFVKSGADIVATADGILYALKGNKTFEFWSYVPPPAEYDVFRGTPAVPGRPAQRDAESPFADGFAAEAPRWNKKGTDVCFFRDDDDGYNQVFMQGASTGGNEVQLTTGATDHEYPVFSPEGDLIACQFYDTLTDCYQLATIAMKSPYAFARFTASEYDHELPEWSPNGVYLVCQRDDSTGYSHIVVAKPSDSTEIRLTSDNADHEEPSFLSDTLIVYTLSPDNGYDQIACINLNTLVQSAATSAQHDHERPDPAFDGRRVAYTFWDDFGTAQVGVADIVGATERALTHGSTDREAPDWSQDGRSIYCVNWTGLTSEIGRVDTSGSYAAVTDDDAIRDNPDAYYRQSVSANDVVFERVTVEVTDGGRRRQSGNGIWLIRHRGSQGDGVQATTTYVLKLERASPNPATDRLQIRWQTPQEQRVRLRVYNTAGQVARTLHDATEKPGAYTTVWDCTDPLGRRLPAGVYFCKLEAEGRSISQKVVISSR